MASFPASGHWKFGSHCDPFTPINPSILGVAVGSSFFLKNGEYNIIIQHLVMRHCPSLDVALLFPWALQLLPIPKAGLTSQLFLLVTC